MSDTEPMVTAALSQLGKPYVWGATGPDSFDCSGLVQWAASQAGINLTRTTYTQVLEGSAGSWPPARGDLVFPDPGHVGIAISGAQMVHAPDVGQNVKVEAFWFTQPFAVRRVGENAGGTGGGLPGGTTGTVPVGTVTAQNASLISDVGSIFSSMNNAIGFFFSTTGVSRMLKIIAGAVLIGVGSWYVAQDIGSMG